MEPLSFKWIAQVSDGELVSGSPDRECVRFCTDSRRIRPGDAFMAIRGERLDGHSFLGEIAERGCLLAIVDSKSKERLPAGVGCVQVADTRQAFGKIAADRKSVV